MKLAKRYGVGCLASLIDVGQPLIGCPDAIGLRHEFPLPWPQFCFDKIVDGMGVPEGVIAAIAARLKVEDFLEDLQIMRNGESIARSLVAEEIVEIVKSGPGDCRHAHRARFMGGQKDQFFRVGCRVELVEPLQGVDLAMPQRIFEFIIGFSNDDRQVGFAQDGCSEDLVSSFHSLLCQGQDFVFDDVQQAGRGR